MSYPPLGSGEPDPSSAGDQPRYGAYGPTPPGGDSSAQAPPPYGQQPQGVPPYGQQPPYGQPSGAPSYGPPGLPPYNQQSGAPGYGAGGVPPYGGPPAYGPGQGDTSKDWMGVAALVLGIIGFCCGPAALAGLVFGILGTQAAANGQATNGGTAKAGLIVSIVAVVLVAGSLILQFTGVISNPFGDF